MTSNSLKPYEMLLKIERAAIKASILQLEVERGESSADKLLEPEHQRSTPDPMEQRDMTTVAQMSALTTLVAIERALAKIADTPGRFGFCETCGAKDRRGAARADSLGREVPALRGRLTRWRHRDSPSIAHALERHAGAKRHAQ
jgi:RNA polymerase-binding transcription factor DksA